MKVYLADDSSAIRSRLHRMLREIDGIEICGEAQDGITAIQGIRDSRPDLAVLDIRMPMGTGLDVLKSLGSDPGRPVLIILTQYSYSQYRKECFDLGADYFLDKSTEFEEVFAIARRLAAPAA